MRFWLGYVSAMKCVVTPLDSYCFSVESETRMSPVLETSFNLSHQGSVSNETCLYPLQLALLTTGTLFTLQQCTDCSLLGSFLHDPLYPKCNQGKAAFIEAELWNLHYLSRFNTGLQLDQRKRTSQMSTNNTSFSLVSSCSCVSFTACVSLVVLNPEDSFQSSAAHARCLQWNSRVVGMGSSHYTTTKISWWFRNFI